MILLALPLFVITSSSLIYLSSSVIVGFGCYFIVKARFRGPESEGVATSGLQIPEICFGGVTSLAVLVLSLSLAVLTLHGSLLLYYVVMSFGLSLIALLILSNGKDSSQIHNGVVIALILAYSVALRASVYFSYPSIVGSDPWYHAILTQAIADSGHTTAIGKDVEGVYQAFPIYHMLTSSGLLVENVDLKMGMFLNGGVVVAFLPLFVYVLFRHLANARTALMAALLVCVLCDFIRWGWWLIPSGFGLPLFVIAINAFLSSNTNRKWRDSILFFTLAIAVALTHLIPAVATLVVCSSFLVFSRINDNRTTDSPVSSVNLRTSYSRTIFLMVAVFLSVVTQSNLLGTTYGFFSMGFSGEFAPSSSETYDNIVLVLFWRLPIIVMIVFGLSGMLITLSNQQMRLKRRNLVRLCTVGFLLGLFCVTSVLATTYYPVVERLLPYSFLCLMGVSAISFLRLLPSRLKPLTTVPVIVGIVAVLVFPLLAGIINNLDPVLPGETTNNVALTEEELVVGNLMVLTHAQVVVDRIYGNYFRFGGYLNRTIILESSDSQSGALPGSIMLIRERYGPVGIRVDPSLSRVVDSGGVKGLMIAP